MNENILKVADLATIANWVMIIGVALLLIAANSVVRTSKKPKPSKLRYR